MQELPLDGRPFNRFIKSKPNNRYSLSITPGVDIPTLSSHIYKTHYDFDCISITNFEYSTQISGLYELLLFISILSGKKIVHLSLSKYPFICERLADHFLNQMNLNVLTHLDIEVPKLSVDFTEKLIDWCHHGKLSFFGVKVAHSQSDIMSRNQSIRLYQQIVKITSITGIAMYFKYVDSIETIKTWFDCLKEISPRLTYLKIDIQYSLNTIQGVYKRILNFLLRTTTIETLDIIHKPDHRSEFYVLLFTHVLSKNTSITSLSIQNHVFGNALELLHHIYDLNFTITKLAISYNERRRSIREKEMKKAYESFLERNKIIAKKHRTMFDLMLERFNKNNEWYVVNKISKQ